jgi:hypothetical protein
MNTAFTAVARWWRQWTATRADLDRLNRCGCADIERIAQDVGVSTSELCALAGKWPDAAEPLNRRLAALGLDPKDIRSVEPQVLHDLQRVCTLCSDKRECERSRESRRPDVARLLPERDDARCAARRAQADRSIFRKSGNRFSAENATTNEQGQLTCWYGVGAERGVPRWWSARSW